MGASKKQFKNNPKGHPQKNRPVKKYTLQEVKRFKKVYLIVGTAILLTGIFFAIIGIYPLGIITILVGIYMLYLRSTFDNLVEEKSTSSGRQTESSISRDTVTPKIPETIIKNPIILPRRKDECPLVYHYEKEPISSPNYELALKAVKSGVWQLEAKLINSEIALYSGNEKIGYLSGNRVNMLSDWIANKDPYFIYIEAIDTDTHTISVLLGFYRDKEKKLSFQEQATVKLTGYRGEDRQLTISLLGKGDELDLDEDFEKEGRIVVSYKGDELGSLPKKYADKFLSQEIIGCFFSHSDYDSEKDLEIPFVNIYW